WRVPVGYRRPVVAAQGACLDEREVPAGLRVAEDVEGQLRAARRNGDRPGDALVGGLADVRVQELGTGCRRDGRREVLEERRVDRVPVLEAVGRVGVDVELSDR